MKVNGSGGSFVEQVYNLAPAVAWELGLQVCREMEVEPGSADLSPVSCSTAQKRGLLPLLRGEAVERNKKAGCRSSQLFYVVTYSLDGAGYLAGT